MNAFDSLTGSDNMHTIAFCSAQIFYMGVAIYAPSVALQACKYVRVQYATKCLAAHKVACVIVLGRGLWMCDFEEILY